MENETQSQTERVNPDHLNFIITHVFFPPKLPIDQEHVIHLKTASLFRLIRDAVVSFRTYVESDSRMAQQLVAEKMLSRLYELKWNGNILAGDLEELILRFEEGEVLVLPITGQNSGIILRHKGYEIVFESFEASPPAAQVLKTEGRLQCSYPTLAIAAKTNQVKSSSFLKELVRCLEHANHQAYPGSSLEEEDSRSTVGMLMSILRGIGRQVESNYLLKHTRDDVQGSWRRSPDWLVVRVALQTTLDPDHYKPIMLHFMSRILETSLNMNQYVSSESLFIMNAKISRRIYKTEYTLPTDGLDCYSRVVESTVAFLHKKWLTIQERSSNKIKWDSKSFNGDNDINLSLTNVSDYPSKLALSYDQVSTKERHDNYGFRPSHKNRFTVASNMQFEPSEILGEGPVDFIHLMDFEEWVRKNIDEWIDRNRGSENCCKDLGKALETYVDASDAIYKGNPESYAIRLLTILEIWVSLDKVVTSNHPILLKYSPEIPAHALEKLRLPKACHMKQLHKVEGHIRERYSRGVLPSVFSSEIKKDSLPVQFFDQSKAHQALEGRILSDSEKEWERKVAEFAEKETEYKKYKLEEDRNSCTAKTIAGRLVHETWPCKKCEPGKKAAAIKIKTFTDYLPPDLLIRKAIIFELLCPKDLAIWRAITFAIITEIYGRKAVTDEGPQSAPSPLEKYFQQHSQHLGLTAVEGSFFGFVGFPATLDDIKTPSTAKYCLTVSGNFFGNVGKRVYAKNLSKLMGVDLDGHFPVELLESVGVKVLKSLSSEYNLEAISNVRYSRDLPEGPYKALQNNYLGTSHTSNQILANQWRCPSEITLHEFYAFGSLRAGHRLQWSNIARELRVRCLSFGEIPVAMLIIQSILQSGPMDAYDFRRESHACLKYPAFCHAILEEIEDLWKTIQQNWLRNACGAMLVSITLRVFSLNTDKDVKERAVALLRFARTVTMEWVTKLLSVQEEQTEIDNAIETNLLRVACICRTTYDVDHEDLEAVLRTDEDVAIAIECGTVIRKNTPSEANRAMEAISVDGVEGISDWTLDMLHRDRRISHFLENRLGQLIVNQKLGIDKVISKLVTGCGSGAVWEFLSKPNNRWLRTSVQTTSGKLTESVMLHLNLLNGEFLVNNSLLTGTPQNLLNHPTYYRLFGENILEVCPTSMPEMQYQSNKLFLGHQIFFALNKDDLRVRAKKQNHVWELVPHAKLLGDFPNSFIHEYCHWYNFETHVLEFRPLEAKWIQNSPKGWFLHNFVSKGILKSAGPMPRLICGKFHLVDVRSKTAEMICNSLKGLESPEFIEITLSEKGQWGIALPRLKLSFTTTDKGDYLKSSQFPGYFVEEDQTFGSFIGLISYLVLRKRSHTGLGLGDRKVIVPYGDVSFHSFNGHVQVEIKTAHMKDVRYYIYDVDPILGRLVGNSTLGSRLYKSYLHAVTSHCLSDPLTGRTGTEEALQDLHSGATWSFQRLEEHELFMMQKIAALTPKYEKKHTIWRDLPGLSQHEGFLTLVRDLLNYAKRLNIFYSIEKIETILEELMHLDQRPIRRAAARNSVFRTHEYGGYVAAITTDGVYEPREDTSSKFRQKTVCELSFGTNYNLKPPCLTVSTNLFDEIRASGQLKHRKDLDRHLGFDSSWLSSSVRNDWCRLYEIFQSNMEVRGDKYRILFLLSSLVYAGFPVKLVWSLYLVAIYPNFRSSRFELPGHENYNLEKGIQPNRQVLLESALKPNQVPSFSDSTERPAPAIFWTLAVRQSYNKEKEKQQNELLEHLISQWPCERPNVMDFEGIDSVFRGKEVQDIADNLYQEWYKNLQFSEHIAIVQKELDASTNDHSPLNLDSILWVSPDPEIKSPSSSSKHVYYPSLDSCFRHTAPVLPSQSYITTFNQSLKNMPLEADQEAGIGPAFEYPQALKPLIEKFVESTAVDSFEHNYALDLQQSFHELWTDYSKENPVNCTKQIIDKMKILELRIRAEGHVTAVLDILKKHLTIMCSQDEGSRLMLISGLLPCITPTSLLRRLTKEYMPKFMCDTWKRALVTYGEAITFFQESIRLGNAPESQISNLDPGRSRIGWDPMDCPDWLLMEIESNMLIRPLQAEVAHEMMAPSSGANSVFQLNMGEGKTSIIIPIVSVRLADSTRLVRVVVLKPLSAQMFRLLIQRVGDLLNRRVFYAPFSRTTKLTLETVKEIRSLFEECVSMGGIFLVQPDHLLSFKLTVWEKLCSESDQGIADNLSGTLKWLEEYARDLLDESDEILHVNNQLIYTFGLKNPLELYPDRWIIVQQMFDLMQKCLKDIQEEFPEDIQVETNSYSSENRGGKSDYTRGHGIKNGADPQIQHHGSFPSFRIINDRAGEQLMTDLAFKVCHDQLPSVSFRCFDRRLRRLLRKFVENEETSEKTSKRLLQDDLVRVNKTTKSSLYLLRGLISGGILHKGLKKRYRVEYGLDPERPNFLAVPYKAKDTPSGQSEFSHPDVAITLTCLAYYYTGLTAVQIKQCFQLLFQLEDRETEYKKWLQPVPINSMPEAIRSLEGLNLEDKDKYSNIICPFFKMNKGTIDFFLAQVVFPREIREFPAKLSSSSWDIAEERKHPTTGFSGTSDSRYLLPISIEQRDLPSQLSTNARTIGYILRPENDVYLHARNSSTGQNLSDSELVKLINDQEPFISVILDVGAQFLRMKNSELSALWLSLVDDPNYEAVIFFDNNHEMCVRTRDGRTDALVMSPYSAAGQLDRCLVYLDQVHTRGTDLKLPTTSRAAVTIGPNMTKDSLIQACMRMRQLGHGQSVMFFAPPEVDRSIRNLIGHQSDSQYPITTADIMYWVLMETCTSTRNLASLCAAQGLSYQDRLATWNQYKTSEVGIAKLKAVFLEPESRSLESLYGVSRVQAEEVGTKTEFKESEKNRIRNWHAKLGIQSLRKASEGEEQERELWHQASQKNTVDRPTHAKAAKENLHPDVEDFILTGEVPADSPVFIPAFESLKDTSCWKYRVPGWDADALLVTEDFATTIDLKDVLAATAGPTTANDYLRPVNWVLSSNKHPGDLLVIISPFEAQSLFPTISRSKHVVLHLYAPRLSINTRSLENLDFIAFPAGSAAHARPSARLTHHLNLFAGQLYLRSYASYQSLCAFLGVLTDDTNFNNSSSNKNQNSGRGPGGDDIRPSDIQSDGYVLPEGRKRLQIFEQCTFQESPVALVRELVSCRRKGLGSTMTHIGKICHGKVLVREEFEGTVG
ncbi:hypothetical protein EDC01DRAFT_673091 [Geopyxis carbonaria]|nr:hypothetical protein EDC01DRAFT_673091 [Geopyxis carbonaria]